MAEESDDPRYAIYFAPAAGTALWRFGCSILGYDAAASREVPRIGDWSGFPAADTAFGEPARYGFHATLKAPFVLAGGMAEAALVAAVGNLARRWQPFVAGRLAVTVLDRFLALTPANAGSELERLAADCVCQLDPFRAPLSQADRERRHRAGLTPRQAGLLERWGYPYVLEEFQFHMTLAGPLDAGLLAAARRIIAGLYAPIDRDLTIDGIAIFKQEDRASRFRIMERFPLGS